MAIGSIAVMTRRRFLYGLPLMPLRMSQRDKVQHACVCCDRHADVFLRPARPRQRDTNENANDEARESTPVGTIYSNRLQQRSDQY